MATSYRDPQQELMRAKRAAAKDVEIPRCADRRRRARLEKSDEKWLRYYFSCPTCDGTGRNCACINPFWYPFTRQQLEMIHAVHHAIRYGGDQALAASRGEGKTTIAERLLIKYTLQGLIGFSVLFGATGPAAENSLDSIKLDLTDNERLRADYPEVCVPIMALENTPQRAKYQTVSGYRHDNAKRFERVPSAFSWCGRQIVLPSVPGSPSSGAIIATRGLDAAVRGLKVRGKRPELALIDDPDTADTARSEDQARQLEERIDKDIGGLGGQRRGLARVMLTTLQSRISASYRFTDPQEKPTWRGRRFRFLLQPPERADMWEQYVSQRKTDFEQGDQFARNAHRYYLENREEMDRGAVVANPYRFDGSLAGDGEPLEVSSLQRYFNEVARIGPAAVATELDNDPPEDETLTESKITPYRVRRQVSGYPRGVVPEGCRVITQGIDVRKRMLHWVVRAWKPDATGYVIDYGVHEIHGTVYGSDEGVDLAIREAVLDRMEQTKAAELRDEEGTRRVDLTLIDAGYRTDAVYATCAEIGVGIAPVMGFGKSAGCVKVSFSDYRKRTPDKRPGDGWFQSRIQAGLWLVAADADRWKAWEHDRWMTPPGSPGCMYLFGVSSGTQILSDDEMAHHAYAHHICAEVEVEEAYKGVIRRYWKPKSKNNHWLDASYYANVAAAMLGVRLEMPQTARPVVAGVQGKRKGRSLREMREAAK